MSGAYALERFVARLLSRSRLTSEEQQAILGLKHRTVHFAPRVDIVSPGQTVEHACLIAQGIAARFDQMRSGQRQITAFYIPGDMCDLHSVVAPTAAWGISAITAATVIHVAHSGLRELVNSYPDIALAFWRDGTADASILAKWVGNLGRQDARSRLAHIICEFAIRMEQAELGTRHSFELRITQEQLADAVGLTPVHVNRTLQRLRAEGLIRVQSHRIEIIEWEQLVAAAEFDAAYLLLGQQNDPGRGSSRVAAESALLA